MTSSQHVGVLIPLVGEETHRNGGFRWLFLAPRASPARRLMQRAANGPSHMADAIIGIVSYSRRVIMRHRCVISVIGYRRPWCDDIANAAFDINGAYRYAIPDVNDHCSARYLGREIFAPVVSFQ